MVSKKTLCMVAVNTFVMAIAFHLVAYSSEAHAVQAGGNTDDITAAKNLSIVSCIFGWITVILVLVCSFMKDSAVGPAGVGVGY